MEEQRPKKLSDQGRAAKVPSVVKRRCSPKYYAKRTKQLSGADGIGT